MNTPPYHLFALGAALLLAGCRERLPSGEFGEPADAGEYTFNVRTPGEGSVVRGTFKVDVTASVVVKDEKGQPVPDAENPYAREEIHFVETIEEFPDGAKGPAKSRVVFEKWVQPRSEGADVTASGAAVTVGREIVVENRGGWYDIHAADGNPIPPGLRRFLDRRYQGFYEDFDARAVLPGKPVRVSDTWPVPVRPLVRALGDGSLVPFDESKSAATARLGQVFERDGRQYARVTLTADLAPNFTDKDITAREANVELSWEATLCIDGSRHDVHAVATVNASFDLAHANKGTAKGSVSGTVTITEVEVKVGATANPAAPK